MAITYFALNKNSLTKLVSIIAVVSLMLSACTPGVKTQERPAFFDLNAYITGEQERLAGTYPLLVRASYFNETRASDSIQAPDYKQDLDIFARSDINRPSWRDQYSIDSIRSTKGDTLLTIRYQAQEPDLKTRLLEIDFERGEVSRVHVYNETDNWIAGTRQKLTYWPDKGYLVEARQRIIWTSNDTLSMSGTFLGKID